MIDQGYVQLMARYNAWQNNQLMSIFDAMTTDELLLDRGAFFGSVLATVNHLVWGDMLWMNRFDPQMPEAPVCADGGCTLFANAAAWGAQRSVVDAQISQWASKVTAADLQGDLTMQLRMTGETMVRPVADCVTGVFNHQTHHRGQVHAMITAAGYDAPVTDLILMPEE